MASVKQALAWYEGRLQSRPLPTKQISAGVVAVLAEVCCQRLSTHRGLLGPLNWRGLAQQLLVAVLMVAPLAHTWHGRLNAKLEFLPQSLRKVLLMVVLEQAVFAPLINSLFIAVNSRLDGLSADAILRKLRSSMPDVMKGSVGVWGLAGLVNYGVVRVEYRVLFGNLVGLGWTIWLLLRTQGQAKPPRCSEFRALALGLTPRTSPGPRSADDSKLYETRRSSLQGELYRGLRKNSLSSGSLSSLLTASPPGPTLLEADQSGSPAERVRHSLCLDISGLSPGSKLQDSDVDKAPDVKLVPPNPWDEK